MINKDIKQQIEQLSKELHLPTFRHEFEELASEAAKESLSYEQFLLKLMEREYIIRDENRRKTQVRRAGFAQYKHLHELCREDLPSDANTKLTQMERLEFIKTGQNII